MAAGSVLPSQAVIICTRNRPAALRRTLRSIEALGVPPSLFVLIVDGSTETQARANRTAIAAIEKAQELDVQYLPFPTAPAGTRQRNYGIDHLPPSTEIVHFIDDDVIVLPGYFDRLASTLAREPDVGGIGGWIIDPKMPRTSPLLQPLKRFFLLSSARPGRVLPSGHVSPPLPASECAPVEWLSTCASTYRRAVFDEYRFDPAVEGASPRLEDLDFSYRVGRSWRLLAHPRARLIHCRSSIGRRGTAEYAAEALPRRYWFVEKNIRHPLRKPAFWWATLGRALAMITSSQSEKWAALRGLLRGIRTVWQRNHSLLQPPM